MARISQKRQREISVDRDAIQRLYEAACSQWGQAAVDADHTRIWDLRCIWGMKRILPFGALFSDNLSEVLWVAEEVCGIGRPPSSVGAIS